MHLFLNLHKLQEGWTTETAAAIWDMPVRRISQEDRRKFAKTGGIHDHEDLDFWHGMIPDEDTALLLKVKPQFTAPSSAGLSVVCTPCPYQFVPNVTILSYNAT